MRGVVARPLALACGLLALAFTGWAVFASWAVAPLAAGCALTAYGVWPAVRTALAVQAGRVSALREQRWEEPVARPADGPVPGVYPCGCVLRQQWILDVASGGCAKHPGG